MESKKLRFKKSLDGYDAKGVKFAPLKWSYDASGVSKYGPNGGLTQKAKNQAAADLARLRARDIDHYDYKHGRVSSRVSRRVPMEDQIEIITIGRTHGLKPAA